MVIFAMGCSVDGFISDRDGSFAWGAPDDELFAVHLERVSSLGGYVLGRRLYETMLPWEHDPAMRGSQLHAQFADVWTALPKVVFSRTLDGVSGNARLATGTLADELAAMVGPDDAAVEIGGADLAGQAIEQGLVDELHIFRAPVLVGGGTPHLPPVTADVQLELVEARTFTGRLFERYRRVASA